MRRRPRSSPRPVEGRLRIVGGRWRSRRIAFPSEEGVRPTPDRVRETLFNWLGTRVVGAECLDLFAGSGALGLEAASRGASHVTLIDHHPRVASALRESVQTLGADNVEVHRGNALAWLECAREAYDVVFLDPPYAARDLLESCITLIAANGILSAGGRLYMETFAEGGLPDLPEGWRTLRSGRAGEIAFALVAPVEVSPESAGELV